MQQADVLAKSSTPQVDVEAADMAPATEACQKEYMGRTASEWGAFGPSLGSIMLIVFGCLYFSDCSGIPSLPAYALVFGTLSVSNGSIAIIFRTEKATADSAGGSVALKVVVALIGLSLLGCAVWGAVITWGETSRFGDSPDCASSLYSASFISSVIVCAVMAMMLLGSIGCVLKEKFGSEGTNTPKSPIAKAVEEQQSKDAPQA